MIPNLLYTLWFNLRAFGLRRGLQFPVYVYARVKVYHMGRIDIKCPIRRGMLKIGMNYANTALPYTIWNNQGVIELHGCTWIHHGCKLQNQGRIVFRGGDIISHACVFDIRSKIEFGKNVSVGYCSEFTDSDVHYMVDVDSRVVLPNKRPIAIGNFNWLGSHTFVKKGAVTPDYTIVASPNAVLLKDYSRVVPPYSILGGSPAHVIGHGKRRVLNFRNEIGITASFAQGNDLYTIPNEVSLDEFCELV